MTETIGVLIAVLSSTFGGTSGAVTRYVVGVLDPVTIAAFRFGIGVIVLAPLALVTRSALPRGRDWLGVAGLGVMFFGVFFVFYNLALGYTTAARGALALSTLPLWTMVVAALLGAEPLTARKTLGVCIALAALSWGCDDEPKKNPFDPPKDAPIPAPPASAIKDERKKEARREAEQAMYRNRRR